MNPIPVFYPHHILIRRKRYDENRCLWQVRVIRDGHILYIDWDTREQAFTSAKFWFENRYNYTAGTFPDDVEAYVGVHWNHVRKRNLS